MKNHRWHKSRIRFDQFVRGDKKGGITWASQNESVEVWMYGRFHGSRGNCYLLTIERHEDGPWLLDIYDRKNEEWLVKLINLKTKDLEAAKAFALMLL